MVRYRSSDLYFKYDLVPKLLFEVIFFMDFNRLEFTSYFGILSEAIMSVFLIRNELNFFTCLALNRLLMLFGSAEVLN
jgi:hypothetical protein